MLYTVIYITVYTIVYNTPYTAGLFDFPPGGLPCFVRHIGLQANKPAKNIYRAKHVDQEISSGSNDADDAMEPVQGTLTSHCGAGFLHRIAPVMTLECIARIDNKWYSAHNKTICANMMRAIVRYDNIQGLSKIYDRLRVKLPRAEPEVAEYFICKEYILFILLF
jgi:hypothetical protein